MHPFLRFILVFAPLIFGTDALLGQSITDSESITIQGKGTAKTRSFAVKDNWVVQVTADAAITVNSLASDGSAAVLVNFPAATPPPPVYTGSSARVAKGGIFVLSIETTGTWQVTVVESGYVKDLVIGGSPAPAATPTAAAPAAATPAPPANAAPVPSFASNGTSSLPHYALIALFNRKTDVGAMEGEETDSFTTDAAWRLAWSSAKGVKITLEPSNGTPSVLVEDTSAGSADPQNNDSGENQGQNHYPNGITNFSRVPANSFSNNMYHGVGWGSSGTYRLKVEGPGTWTLAVSSLATTPAAGSPALAASPTPAATTNAAPVTPAPIVTLSEDQARAVVLIKGDNAQGTGFMIKTPDGPAVITNIHVIANNPNLKITTNTGAFVTVLSEKGASDRDLAMLSIKDDGYSYFEFSTDISRSVQPGDEVITPGNSEGGEVMLNTGGKLLGIGPVRLEIDNPIYHGNSGGPIFHPKSGKVLGVVTEAIKVNTTDDLDKVSFANRNSAISGTMRYFGLRLDTVSAWVPIESRRFQIETTFLDEFHEQSRRLDAYLNHSDSDRDEAERVYESDEKIMKANDNYREHNAGTDTAQHIDLVRSLVFDLQCVADQDMDQIQNKDNFYSFDQDRAQDEYAYRKALKDELESISSDVEHASFLPRSNN